MSDQAKLDAALVQIQRHFSGEAEHYLLSNDRDSQDLVATLASQGLIYCKAKQMITGNILLRWTSTRRITPAGLERLAQIKA